MKKQVFLAEAASEKNPKWADMVRREEALYERAGDTRSPFLRDYTRIIHSSAFRRLKHKTQVFFSPQSDHICTRIEHVLHVESISNAIADSLGLNGELARGIAIGHDLGHSPFGHKGERALDEISRRVLGESFWHEKNSLFLVDRVELLEDADRRKQNLDLTYAVRDGLISHCGETKQNHLFPRKDAVDLYSLERPGVVSPYTYEGCVVKMADRISYIGRDIEDALSLGVLDAAKLAELGELIGAYTGDKINNTIIINHLIFDLCASSDPDNGICFSDRTAEWMALLRDFNYKNIYQANRVTKSERYFNLVIDEIFNTLFSCFDGENTLSRLEELKKVYLSFGTSFLDWISCYWHFEREPNLKNPPIFDIRDKRQFARAVLCYISGMTDKYAMDSYNDIISF